MTHVHVHSMLAAKNYKSTFTFPRELHSPSPPSHSHSLHRPNHPFLIQCALVGVGLSSPELVLVGSAHISPKNLCSLHVLLLLTPDEAVSEVDVLEGTDEDSSVVTVRDVLVSVTVVVRTSVDVETGSLQPNQPGSLHVDVVSLPLVLVDDGISGGDVGLVCGGSVEIELVSSLSLHPHHPGVAQ